jgi:hypothetical protein
VPVLWGLELLCSLADARAITKAKAKQVGEAICRANGWMGPSVLERFLVRVQGKKGGCE